MKWLVKVIEEIVSYLEEASMPVLMPVLILVCILLPAFLVQYCVDCILLKFDVGIDGLSWTFSIIFVILAWTLIIKYPDIKPYKATDADGRVKTYFFGKLRNELSYKNNRLDGLCKTYHWNGIIKYLDTYVGGVLVHRKAFNCEGKLKFEQDY